MLVMFNANGVTMIRCGCGYLCPLDEIDIDGMHGCTITRIKEFDAFVKGIKKAQKGK